jgi:hypothetical protein
LNESSVFPGTWGFCTLGGAVNRDFTDLTERFESMAYFSLKLISMEKTVGTSEHVSCDV